MSDPKPNNPLVVVLLIVGIIGALGFAIWRALGPASPAPSQAPAPAAQAQSPSPDAPGPSVAPAKGATSAPEAPQRSLVADSAALGVNPFGGGVTKTTQPRPAPLASAPRPSSAPRQTLPAPALISQDRSARAQALKAFADSNAPGPAATQGAPASPQPMPVAVEPELVGTMLGGRPTAVFKADKTLLMVPQGGVYMGWRVMRVGHSEATVWNGGVQLRLRVGMPSSPVSHAEATPPSPTGFAASNFVIVHQRSRPAPTRQDLVYGRVEDPVQYGATEELATSAEPLDEPTDPVVEPGELTEGQEEPPPTSP
ncbi:MAG: hypothetical protein GX446_19050 [Chthonomonadales bacterium]|nr:hypothetical protein [Chthonomonadales bacterium]